jgi:hypothetical protein
VSRRCASIAAASLLFWVTASDAHKLSDSYLTLTVADRSAILQGQWDIALRDLDYALGLDIDHDGAITWGELKSREEQVTEYAFSRLTVEAIARGDRSH